MSRIKAVMCEVKNQRR